MGASGMQSFSAASVFSEVASNVIEVASVFCVNPRRYWSAIAAAVASGLAAYGILFAAQFWRVLPFSDQWEAVAFYRTWTSTGFSFSALIGQHNEHRIP